MTNAVAVQHTNAGENPSGAELLLANDTKALQALQKWILAKAARARENIVDFFEFVMREETTRKPIRCAPHQKVLLDFALFHDRSVIMMPIGHSKTFCMAALTLFMLGQDVTKRGAIVSATQEQAAKVLAMVRDYIENSIELKIVFPHLKRSSRDSDPWTQTRITVDRPPGIRDPSLVAVGIQGSLPGSRLNWIVVDDILTDENTRTQEQRETVNRWFENTVTSRLDPVGAKIVVTNTAWHPDDLPHTLERQGWATLRMQVLGNIEVKDDAQRVMFYEKRGEEFVPFDSEELRPLYPNIPTDPWCRLAANDNADGQPAVGRETLWPERMPLTSDDPRQKTVETERLSHLPHVFNQLYMQECRDDATARCQIEWIERCKLRARQENVLTLVSRYDGPYPTFTGVDLAVKATDANDYTAFFTFLVRPDGLRQILDIEIGRFNGPTILRKIKEKVRAYNSVIRVEDNAAQGYIRQFVLDEDISIPIKPHTTTQAKAASYGVESIFIEFMNGAWLIPNNIHGQCHPNVQKFIDACLYYVPTTHTADVLMASYFAREQAKDWGLLSGEMVRQSLTGGSTIASDIMLR